MNEKAIINVLKTQGFTDSEISDLQRILDANDETLSMFYDFLNYGDEFLCGIFFQHKPDTLHDLFEIIKEGE